MRLRLATLNAPESRKRGLISSRTVRAARVRALFVNRRIDIAAVQESGTHLANATKRGAAKSVWAKFNDFVNGRRIGNGVVVKRLRFKTRKVEDLTIGTGEDAINIAVVDVTHRRTGWTVRVRGIHKPTRRALNASLRPVVDAALKEAHRRDDNAGIPWLDLGDMNGAAVEGVALGDHGPDHIRGSKDFEPISQKVVNRPGLSDHHFLIADVAVDI